MATQTEAQLEDGLIDRLAARGWERVTLTDEAALIAHVRETLAAYKSPKRVLPIDSIGRAANGKLDYKRLKSEALDRLGLS